MASGRELELFASGGRPLSVPPVDWVPSIRDWVLSILQTLRMAPAAETYAKVAPATIEETKVSATDEELLGACFTLGGSKPTVTPSDITSQSDESAFFELYWEAPNVKRFAKLCMCVGDKEPLKETVESRRSGLKRAGSDNYPEGPFVKFDAYDIKVKYKSHAQLQGIVILMEFVEPPDYHAKPSLQRGWEFDPAWKKFVKGARDTIGRTGDNYYDMSPRHIGMKVRTSDDDPFEFRHLAPDRLNDKKHFPEFPLWTQDLLDRNGLKWFDVSEKFAKEQSLDRKAHPKYRYGQMDYACETTCALTSPGATNHREFRQKYAQEDTSLTKAARKWANREYAP